LSKITFYLGTIHIKITTVVKYLLLIKGIPFHNYDSENGTTIIPNMCD